MGGGKDFATVPASGVGTAVSASSSSTSTPLETSTGSSRGDPSDDDFELIGAPSDKYHEEGSGAEARKGSKGNKPRTKWIAMNHGIAGHPNVSFRFYYNPDTQRSQLERPPVAESHIVRLYHRPRSLSVVKRREPHAGDGDKSTRRPRNLWVELHAPLLSDPTHREWLCYEVHSGRCTTRRSDIPPGDIIQSVPIPSGMDAPTLYATWELVKFVCVALLCGFAVGAAGGYGYHARVSTVVACPPPKPFAPLDDMKMGASGPRGGTVIATDHAHIPLSAPTAAATVDPDKDKDMSKTRPGKVGAPVTALSAAVPPICPACPVCPNCTFPVCPLTDCPAFPTRPSATPVESCPACRKCHLCPQCPTCPVCPACTAEFLAINRTAICELARDIQGIGTVINHTRMGSYADSHTVFLMIMAWNRAVDLLRSPTCFY
jgi:hypothetical protein